MRTKRNLMLSAAVTLLLAGPALAAQYGASLPAGEATAVSAALAAGPSAEPRLFSGRITEVCQKKGCWAMLEHEGQAVRLTMHEHAFFLPKDYRGQARVYGTLSKIELSEQMAKHLAEDAGKSEPVAQIEYRIDTLGIELLEEAGKAAAHAD